MKLRAIVGRLDAPPTDGHLALERGPVFDMHPPGLDLTRNLARRLKLKVRFGVYRTEDPPWDYCGWVKRLPSRRTSLLITTDPARTSP